MTPALRSRTGEIGLWPFDGALSELLGSRPIVVAEIYPAEAYRHLGFPHHGWSKRTQADRRARGNEIRAWLSTSEVGCRPTILTQIAEGFGPRESGEDAFDAVVGLCSMLDVLLGAGGDDVPNDELIQQVEGWILGQRGS